MLELDRDTTTGSGPTALFRVMVPVVDAPPNNDVGLSSICETATGMIVRVVLFAPLPKPATTVATIVEVSGKVLAEKVPVSLSNTKAVV